MVKSTSNESLDSKKFNFPCLVINPTTRAIFLAISMTSGTLVCYPGFEGIIGQIYNSNLAVEKFDLYSGQIIINNK